MIAEPKSIKLTIDPNDVTKERGDTLMKSVFTVVAGCVPGDLIEFGTGDGVSFMALALSLRMFDGMATKRGQGGRILHGFDSFTGLPAAVAKQDLESPMVELGIWREHACWGNTKIMLADMAVAQIPEDRFALHEGMFKDSMPRDIKPGQKFAVVHVDCDLYASSLEVLEFLTAGQHFADGCIVLFDDFLENRGSPYLGQRAAWLGSSLHNHYMVTDLGHYSRSGWRFMLHTGLTK